MQKTKSEDLLERFLREQCVPFERVPVVPNVPKAHRPDYEVHFGDMRVFFEVKELAPNSEFDLPAPGEFRARIVTVGEHLRRLIKRAAKQMKHGAAEGVASVLVVYNGMDPMQLLGTEKHDFEAAMYGAHTLMINRYTRALGDAFFGRDKSFTKTNNTSFAALGHLSDRGGTPTLTLYENCFAKFPLHYDAIPPSISLVRAQYE